MRRVLFVILGIDFSGAENVLVQFLMRNEFIFPTFAFIYQGAASKKFKELFGAENCIELNVKYRKNELRFFPQFSQKKLADKLLPVIDRIQPDSVYFNNTLEVILSKRVVKVIDIPCLGHIHDMKASIRTLPKVRAAKKAFVQLSEILTVSNACKKSWRNSRMRVVYNGIPDSYYQEKSHRFRKGNRIIGYVGMLSNRKGFDLLVQVIQNLGNNYIWKIAYNIVEENLKYLIPKLELMDNVQLFYQIPSSEMIHFYDEIDILIIPSREDPLPTVAIEAMARRVLVLGANTGGIPELVGEESFLFQRNNVEAIEHSIKWYLGLNNKDFEKQVEKQYQYARDKFSEKNKIAIVNSVLNAQLKK